MSKILSIIKGMQIAKRPSDYWVASDTNFPELDASHTIIQRNGQSVWDHTMAVIDALETKNHITLLAGLFHDLGKCSVKNIDNPSMPRFPCHATASANIARIKLTEWQASLYLIDRVMRIVLTHMYDIISVVNEKTIRRFISDVGLDNIENWFMVRRADSASYSQHGQYRKHIIDPFYNCVKEYLETLPYENSPIQLQSEPNIDIRGKECKSDDTFLTTEGG